jgi:uncharacterized membrane protein YdjX (TVP38/TMEM64 family)
MELSETLRDPMGAAMVAAGLTAAYIYLKQQLNNEPQKELNAYLKPAVLNAVMVYFIIDQGISQREMISTEPF